MTSETIAILCTCLNVPLHTKLRIWCPKLLIELSSVNQDTKAWYLCYHSNKYPVTTFVHLDDVNESPNESVRVSSFSEEPNANSTVIGSGLHCQTDPCLRYATVLNNSLHGSKNTSPRNVATHSECPSGECSHDVGHWSHIPRIPPHPTTCIIPPVINKSTITCENEEDLFGMIKLKDNDVCYTSGTIEWVGRKRSFPINSGFKIIHENQHNHEPLVKKMKKLNKTFTCDMDKLKECDCANMLPTVNAIVDHLNALHEAVDIVDLRLNTLEGNIGKA